VAGRSNDAQDASEASDCAVPGLRFGLRLPFDGEWGSLTVAVSCLEYLFLAAAVSVELDPKTFFSPARRGNDGSTASGEVGCCGGGFKNEATTEGLNWLAGVAQSAWTALGLASITDAMCLSR